MKYSKQDLWDVGFYDTGCDEILGEYGEDKNLVRFHLENFLFDHPIKADLIDDLIDQAQHLATS